MGVQLYVHLCIPQTSHTKIFSLHGYDILYIAYDIHDMLYVIYGDFLGCGGHC